MTTQAAAPTDLSAVIDMVRRRPPRVPGHRPGVAVHDERVRDPQDGTEVTVRVFVPARRRRPSPALLWIHGGGFVLGTVDDVHDDAAAVAEALETVVVGIHYRLAPEHRFPAALEDCWTALRWLSRSSDALDLDPDRLVVFGSSAGGALAAGLTLLARDTGGPRIRAQLLSGPVLDDRLTSPSMQAFTDTPKWNRPLAAQSWRMYLPEGTAEAPVLAAPARAEDLSGLPPTYIATAGLDPLRDEGLEYGRRLLAAGVETELHNYPGVYHGFGQGVGAEALRRAQTSLLPALAAALSG